MSRKIYNLKIEEILGRVRENITYKLISAHFQQNYHREKQYCVRFIIIACHTKAILQPLKKKKDFQKLKNFTMHLNGCHVTKSKKEDWLNGDRHAFKH